MSLPTPKVGIIMSTTREARFADRPTQWLLDIARTNGGAHFEIVDLRDYPLPFFDEATSPAWAPPGNETARRLSEKMDSLDAYIFVTAEYQHSIPAALKNALDWLYPEFKRKPVGFVGYGGVGGARAIEHLRNIIVEVQAVPLRSAVHIGMAEYLGLVREGKQFSDFPHLEQGALGLIEDLLWWTNALKAAREPQKAAA